MKPITLSLRACALAACVGALHPAIVPGAEMRIGVAQVDVTPTEPIRLTGYASRKTSSIGVEQRLWAKALAIGSDADGPVVLLTLDNCGIADQTYRTLVNRIGKKAGLSQAQLALCVSHTHTGPCTRDWAPNIFIQDFTPEELSVISRYTDELVDKLEHVALRALADRQPGQLAWSEGKVTFARNRRIRQGAGVQFGANESGPVDHSLAVLAARGADGQLRAALANYACHCTTMGGDFNRVCGDWAGFAQEEITRAFPGAVGLITIGCGADANPHPRGGPDAGLALAKQHGAAIAAEVKRLLEQKDQWRALAAPPRTRLKEVQLPFAPHFSRVEWDKRAQQPAIVGYHARKNLARLDRGEKLPVSLYYPIVTWKFGTDLEWVFLPGEVVVDYALKLKTGDRPGHRWVTAYANYVPCYIPSRRILAEGGYEAEESLWYYDRPARLAPETEDLILDAVRPQD